MTPEQEQKVLESLYDRLYDAVTYAPGGKEGAFPKNAYFQMTKNTVLNPDDFANMMNPANPMGDQAKAEFFSGMVDALPSPGALWSDSGNTLSKFVEDDLTMANTASKPNPEQLATYKAAYEFLNTTKETKDFRGNVKKTTEPSDIALAYEQARSAYINAIAGYRTAYNGYDMSQTADQRKWNAAAPPLQNLVDSTWNAWGRSGKAEVEEAQAALASTINDAVSNAIEEQQRLCSPQYQLPSLTPAGHPWLPSYAIPTNWASGELKGCELALSSAYLDKTSSSTAHSYGVEAKGSYGLFHAKVGVSGESKDERSHMQAENLTLKAELIAVNIRRPWFNPLLLGMKDWWVNGYDAGKFSNGDAASPQGQFPLIPTGFVVARNVSISADFSEEDKSFISNTVNTSVEAGWGPFSLKGNYSYSSSKSEFSSKFDGGTLTLPGLQLIAWISTVPPYCPPESPK